MATLGHRKRPDPCSPCRVTGMLGVQGEGGPPASLGGGALLGAAGLGLSPWEWRFRLEGGGRQRTRPLLSPRGGV